MHPVFGRVGAYIEGGTTLRFHRRVTAVASVVEVMAAIERERPEVILSDLRMPVADGYGLIRKVWALSPERGRPIPTAASPRRAV